MKLLLLICTALSLQAQHPFVYSTDFEWKQGEKNFKNNSVLNDNNVSFRWEIWFNDEFMKAYNGKKPILTEVYEAEYPCWDKGVTESGELSDNNKILKLKKEFDITRNNDFPNPKAFAYASTWSAKAAYPAHNDDDCNAYYTHTSHEKIHVYIDDILLHTFEFTMIPTEYDTPEKTQEQPNYKPYTPPNYAKMYANTSQIILPKLHIYDVKKLSYFRDKKEIIFIEASSGNYAVPKKELKDAKYLLLTKALQKRLSALGVNTTQE